LLQVHEHQFNITSIQGPLEARQPTSSTAPANPFWDAERTIAGCGLPMSESDYAQAGGGRKTAGLRAELKQDSKDILKAMREVH
jgi:hypothetical protein